MVPEQLDAPVKVFWGGTARVIWTSGYLVQALMPGRGRAHKAGWDEEVKGQ